MIPIKPIGNHATHAPRAVTPAEAATAFLKPGVLSLPALPPLSLYVHIPWCVRKCPYCDFNSHEQRGEIPEKEYVDALVADLEASLPDVWGRRIQSIFMGGGPPSLFKPASIDHLLTSIRTRIHVNAE